MAVFEEPCGAALPKQFVSIRAACPEPVDGLVLSEIEEPALSLPKGFVAAAVHRLLLPGDSHLAHVVRCSEYSGIVHMRDPICHSMV